MKQKSLPSDHRFNQVQCSEKEKRNEMEVKQWKKDKQWALSCLKFELG